MRTEHLAATPIEGRQCFAVGDEDEGSGDESTEESPGDIGQGFAPGETTVRRERKRHDRIEVSA